jgi:hypothetical protein
MAEERLSKFKISASGRKMEWGPVDRPAWYSHQHRGRVTTARFRGVHISMPNAMVSPRPNHVPRGWLRGPTVNVQVSICPFFDALCNGLSPSVGLGVDIRIMAEKRGNKFKMSAGSREMEWGPVVVPLGIHVNTEVK